MGNQWLAAGGTYLILGLAWLFGTVGFVTASLRRGATRGEEADGCALALGTFVSLTVGGGVGLRLAPYPWFLVTALGLGLLCPSLLMAFTVRRDRLP